MTADLVSYNVHNSRYSLVSHQNGVVPPKNMLPFTQSSLYACIGRKSWFLSKITKITNDVTMFRVIILENWALRPRKNWWATRDILKVYESEGIMSIL